MLDIITIHNIPEFTVSPEEHTKRNANHKKACEGFVASVKSLNGDYSIFDEMNCGAELPDMVPFANNPKWKDLPYGAANTCGNASCSALQTKVVLDYLDTIASDKRIFADLTPSVMDIIYELTHRGYRSWKLASKPGTMVAPVATLDVIKKRFPNDAEIQNCQTLTEVFEKFGNPKGIGGSIFWLDNVIKLFSFDDAVEIASQTRIHTVKKVVQNISNGIVVPIRVQNSVYLGDENHPGGHYVTWFRIENGMAVIVDTAMEERCGVYRIPVKQLLEAILFNPNMAVVWDVEPAVLALKA